MPVRFLLCCALFVISSALAVAQQIDYRINSHAHKRFAGKDAKELTIQLLRQHPELKRRMLDPTWTVPGEDWGYYSQTYGNESVMSHLIALQIKAMAEAGDLKTYDQLTDSTYGIGSKSHKDKGTINNPLSFWGHPVQSQILQTRSRLQTLKVYHTFRKTIKNELIQYARHRPLEWHLKTNSDKQKEIIEFLDTKHAEATQQLRDELQETVLNLEELILRALESHLLS